MLPQHRGQLRHPFCREVRNETRRRERRVAVSAAQPLKRNQRIGRIQIEAPRQKRIGTNRFHIQCRKRASREVRKVFGDYVLRAASDRRRDDVPIIGVGQDNRVDQRLVSCYPCFGEMRPHHLFLRPDAAFQIRPASKQIARPLIQNGIRPTGAEKTGIIEGQQSVPLPKGKQDVCVEDGDEAVRDRVHGASYSCPSRASVSRASVRAASRLRL